LADICKSCGNPIPTGEAYSRYHGIEAKDGTGVARLPEGPWHKLCIPPRKVSAAEATEDFSSIKLQPILDLWGDLVRAGGMPALQPAHVEAMARALKRAAQAA
jgi:hypothetical protein